MRCQRCQHENPPGVKFCGECGARIEIKCPACGAVNGAANNFCHGCGATLAQNLPAASLVAPQDYTPEHLSERILTSRSALEGERKQITVLFADLKGSMELLAERDAEEARKILDPVLECMMEAVHRFEGTVNQVMGDGIMALFGAPLAHEDHGIRACYAALRMQEAVRRYAQEIQRTQGAPIQIRVGLNSGEVVVRTIGNDLRMDYTAVGHSTHLAARMEQAAMPGTILMGRSTYRLAEGYIQANALGKVRVKGLSEPVDAYELTGAQTVRTRLQAAANRGLTQFVGRNVEIDRLSAAWQQAEKGEGSIVAVVGEPGVGKSRLIYEFARLRSREAWLILESGSVSYGKATAYLPVIELLKSYFKIHDRDDHRSIREKVTGKLLALDESLHSCLAAILALLHTPFGDSQWERLDPQNRRQRTLDAVRRLLLRESEVQPLLVVFEDLHGIDSETQAVIDGLVEDLASAHMLLLVSHRPEYEHEWGSKPNYAQLRLEPLAPDRAENLLDSLLGREAALQPLKRLLIERTGGNPFFLEESVRAFVEIGALIGAPGAYCLGRAVTAMQAPSTVQPVIAARIDRLSPGNKQLLQAAAVIGASVPFSLLHAIADRSEDELRQGLARLVAAEFLYESGLFPEPEYAFKHALIHEVVYDGLLHERQRALHARIMQATESLYGDRIAERVDHLAHHALRGEVWDKAVVYCFQAGAKAAARSAHVEAVARFTDALAAIGHLPQGDSVMRLAVDLRLSLRTSLSPLGEFRRIFELLSQAEAIAKTLDDQMRLARILTFKALNLWSTGQQDRAIEAAEQALLTARLIGEKSAQVLANLFAGRARHACGDYARAIELLDGVIEATDGDRASFLGMANLPSVSARTWLAWSFAELGEFGSASKRADEALTIADAAEDLVSRIYAYMARGIVRLRRGDVAGVLSNLHRAYQLSERENLRMARATVAGYLGRAYTLNGQAAEAIAILKLAIEDADVMGLMVDQAMRLVHLSCALLSLGECDAARGVAQRAVQSAVDHHERGSVAWAYWALGEIEAQDEDRGKAQQHYRAAIALASDLGMVPLRAHCNLAIGKVYERAGEYAQSRAHVVEADGVYRTLKMALWVRETELILQGHPQR